MVNAIQDDIEKRFGGMDQIRLFVAHTDNEAGAQDFCQELAQKLGKEVTQCDPLSLSVACHIGPGALAVACSKKIDRYL